MNSKTFIMSAIIIITYSICWYLVCKFAPTSQNVTENNRMLIKALLVIIMLNMIGVALKSVINFFFQLFMVVNVFVRTPYSIGFSFLTVIVYSINAPVLYKISTEYLAQFNKHLPWIKKFICQTNSNQVSVITVQPH
ncbi:hypothetical protein niasHT_033378 [Heterodera trifolii]|uniref:Uncharacterized protein n=1 Tax=Heterodera trifolii TaxID=157864 RepID=A0ABD2HSN7_9BILA